MHGGLRRNIRRKHADKHIHVRVKKVVKPKQKRIDAQPTLPGNGIIRHLEQQEDAGNMAGTIDCPIAIITRSIESKSATDSYF